MGRGRLITIVVLVVLGVLAGAWFFLQIDDSAPVVTLPDARANTDVPALPDPVPSDHDEQAPTERHRPDKVAAEASDESNEEAATPESRQPPEVREAVPFVVEGVVVDATTSAPVEGATVKVYGPEDGKTTMSDGDGAFGMDFPGWTPRPERFALKVNHENYRTHTEVFEAGSPIRVELTAVAVVNVRLEGAGCHPKSAWLQWEDGETPEQPTGLFDMQTGVARVEASNIPENSLGRAKVTWFGRVLQSDPITLERGAVHEVVLQVPHGASISVRVIGPDARPMADVEVASRYQGDSDMLATTDEQGRAEFTGIPAPARIGLRLRSGPNGKFCLDEQFAEIDVAGDRREVLFDLTRTGIVDCRLMAGDHFLSYLTITPLDGGKTNHVRFGDDDSRRRIYGLKPGRYDVRAVRGRPQLRYEDELEVLPPPNVTKWHENYGGSSVRVHAIGAPRDAELRLVVVSDSTTPEHRPTEFHEWVLEDLSSRAITVMIQGSGYASQAVTIRPEEQRQVDIEVERCGTLNLRVSSPLVMGAYIQGVDPKQPRWPVAPSEGIELPPGRYRLSDRFGVTKWAPVEVTVKPGETTECEIGPPSVSMLIVYADDGVKLQAHEVTLSQDGQKVPCQFLDSGAANRYLLTFSATGKLTFRVEREGYETFEEEVDFENAGNSSIRVTLKKQE